MASKKVKMGTPIARIDVINAKNVKLSQKNRDALMKSICDTLQGTGEAPAGGKPVAKSAKAAAAASASAAADGVDCWIADVVYELIDGQLYRIELWECDDGSSYKKYLPM